MFLTIPEEEECKANFSINITIPGTYEGQASKVSGWFEPGGAFTQAYRHNTGQTLKAESSASVDVAFRWNGKNSKGERDLAGKELGENINNLVQQRGLKHLLYRRTIL